MSRWFDTLFARILLVQASVALLVVVLFLVFAVREQGQSLARATAPVWAAALAPVVQGQATLPHAAVVGTPVQLLAGPPPPDATSLAVILRYRPLALALRAQGVPVRSVRVSGQTGEAVTWLEIEQSGPDGPARWVGVRGEFEGTDALLRAALAMAIGLIAILAAAWGLSRRVVRPLLVLRQHIRRFEADGQMPTPLASTAPVELRELAQQFAELARQRHHLDEQRRTMLAAISHDLRSPLGRIRMAAELLPEAEGVAPRREAINRNVQVADRLLGSFIDMARAEDEPIHGRVDLCALLQAVADGEEDLTLASLPSPPLWLQPASAVALERAVRNLVDNARHHGSAPIELSLHREAQAPAPAPGNGPAHQAVLSVRDHGPGIPPALRAQMLQPFLRGERSRHTPGTGLGLSIVQRTAARHGGQLRLQDAAPGLRAELRLPLP